jgi:uncharacterized protein YjcR
MMNGWMIINASSYLESEKLMATKELLREDMIIANEKQKDLLKKLDLLLESKKSKDKEKALQITHDVAKLQDFIMMAENTLKMAE